MTYYWSEDKWLYYTETQSSLNQRIELQRLLQSLKSNDLVLVTEISRIARSIIHYSSIIEQIFNVDASLIILRPSEYHFTKTSNLMTTMMVNLLEVFAQFERDLISERTKAGLVAARERGKLIGRPRGLVNKKLKKKCWRWAVPKKPLLVALKWAHLR